MYSCISSYSTAVLESCPSMSPAQVMQVSLRMYAQNKENQVDPQEVQGWISDMGIDGPTFVPKSGYFLPILGLSSKVGFFLIFWPILRAGFFDKMLALSNKKSTFVLISGFFGFCIFTILLKNYLKCRFLTKKAP